MITQAAINEMTVEKTGMLSRNLAAVKTVAKSIVFGGTAKPPPNDVRCVHRHCVLKVVVCGPTWRIKYELNWKLLHSTSFEAKQTLNFDQTCADYQPIAYILDVVPERGPERGPKWCLETSPESGQVASRSIILYWLCHCQQLKTVCASDESFNTPT